MKTFKLAKNVAPQAFRAMNFSPTSVDDLWTPDIWIRGMTEKLVHAPLIMGSPAIELSDVASAIATGGGVDSTVPFFIEPDVADEPQVASTAPNINGLTAGKMRVPILNRVQSLGHQALAAAVTATNLTEEGRKAIFRSRLRQRETTLLSALAGAFATAAAAMSKDSFVEDANNVGADHLLDTDLFADSAQLWGERKASLEFGGVMVVHSDVETALLKQDAVETIRNSEGRIVIRTYKGVPIIVNDSLVRDGTTSGKVYSTYLFLPGSIMMGDKPQSTQIGDAASLQVHGDAATNDVVIYDRTRFVLQAKGINWNPQGGVPAAQSASNAELADGDNWTMVLDDIKNFGIVRIQTNG